GGKDTDDPGCGGCEKTRRFAAGTARFAAAGRRDRFSGRDDVTAGARVSQQAEGAARPPDKERRLRRPKVSRGSAQDALRRGRAPLDLRRGQSGSGQRAARGGNRVPPATRAAGRAQLAKAIRGATTRPAPRVARQCAHSNSATPITISTMPAASRVVIAWLNTKREIACANSTSTNASVRTLAAVASAKAREQKRSGNRPMKPATSEGRQARTIAASTCGSRSRRYAVSRTDCSASPTTTVTVAAMT